MQGWLTTVVSRICLDMLRARRSRREELFEDWLQGPIVSLEEPERPRARGAAGGFGWARTARRAADPGSGRAARVRPARHVRRAVRGDRADRRTVSPAATRQLASRARRRVRGGDPDAARTSLAEQRKVVEAFLAASRGGDFEALLEVLDPDVEFRVERGRLGPAIELQGAENVARVVLAQAPQRAPHARPALVNGSVGVVVIQHDRLIAVARCTIEGDRMTAMTVVADPDQLARVRL